MYLFFYFFIYLLSWLISYLFIHLSYKAEDIYTAAGWESTYQIVIYTAALQEFSAK